MKPILFSTYEVLAALGDWKKVARLVVKPQPKKVRHGLWRWKACQWTDDMIGLCSSGMEAFSPYQPGDVFYVREAWQKKHGGGYIYRADMVDAVDVGSAPDSGGVNKITWQSPVHMPKEASRIFLRATDVRASRLQSGFSGAICPLIELEDEGIDAIGRFCEKCKAHCRQFDVGCGDMCFAGNAAPDGMNVLECGMLDCLRQKYSKIWDRTIKPADRALYGWAANPFVWVIVFERISKEEATGH